MLFAEDIYSIIVIIYYHSLYYRENVRSIRPAESKKGEINEREKQKIGDKES